ncbi:hypothetical protein [Salinibacterium sp.]|uniref:hypothetical protein n=1 Tax=Salinibacterium sp. TaxID=1915057 RepID=UPI00286B7D64|nr:hypothetical protein [Salinibacterium sp.]
MSYVEPNDFWSYTPVSLVGVYSITLTVRVTDEGGAYTDASKTITVATTAPLAAMVATELAIVVVISRRRRKAVRSPALG